MRDVFIHFVPKQTPYHTRNLEMKKSTRTRCQFFSVLLNYISLGLSSVSFEDAHYILLYVPKKPTSLKISDN